MMIKFSWTKINNKFGWNAYQVLQYFFLKGGIIKNKSLLIKTPKNVIREAMLPLPTGDCYLLNLKNALENTKDPNHLYNYLELASKRSLFDYVMRGIIYLPMYNVPEYLRGLVETNPMLEVKDDKIYFKYEQE